MFLFSYFFIFFSSLLIHVCTSFFFYQSHEFLIRFTCFSTFPSLSICVSSSSIGKFMNSSFNPYHFPSFFPFFIRFFYKFTNSLLTPHLIPSPLSICLCLSLSSYQCYKLLIWFIVKSSFKIFKIGLKLFQSRFEFYEKSLKMAANV